VNYRNKRIEPTIIEYERQLAAALDVEPETVIEKGAVVVVDGKPTIKDVETVDQEKTKTKATKALSDLRKKWKPAFQSWQDLYDTWPEHRDPAGKKAEAVAKFAQKASDADDKLEAKEWSMEDKARKRAEKDQAT